MSIDTPWSESDPAEEALRHGSSRADFEKTFADLYQEARRIARQALRGGGMPWHRDSTLHTTALVNEAYLRFGRRDGVKWRDQSHFLALVAQAMRFALVDYARSHARAKRGGGQPRVPIEESLLMTDEISEELLELDRALDRLALRSERLARVVECRFIVGWSIEETSSILGVSTMTVKRDWISAKAFLARELRGLPLSHGGES